jgi:zinc transport system permease protein
MELFQYDFMVRAMIAGLLVAIIGPFIGTFLVAKKYSLFADTLSHVSLLGAAIGFLFQINPLFSSLVVSSIAGLTIEKLKERSLQSDALLGMIMSGSFAVAAIVISLTKTGSIGLIGYLFGSITTVSPSDLWVIGCISVGIFVILIIFYQQLFAVSFDEDIAFVGGISVRIVNILFVLVSALFIAFSMRIVGVLLISALMIIPVLSAIQIAKSFAHTIGIACAISLVSMFIGLISSFYMNIPTGPAVVVVCLLFFLVISILRSKNR